MIYIAVQHLTDDGESLYKTNTLHQAFQFIIDKNVRNFTVSDMPFLDNHLPDNSKEITDSEYEVIQ